jgi:hypothetical protein
MALVLLTQYFDTLRDIGTRGGTNTLFLPNNPGAASDLQTQILAGLRGAPLPPTPGPNAAHVVEPQRPFNPPPPPVGTPGTPNPYSNS